MPRRHVEQEEQKWVHAGGKRRHEENQRFHRFWIGNGKTEQRGKREEGDREEEEAVGKKQPCNMSSKRCFFFFFFCGGGGLWSLFRAAVETSVSERHEEETQRVQEHQRDGEHQGGKGRRGGRGGKRKAERGSTVADHQGGESDEESKQEAGTDGETEGEWWRKATCREEGEILNNTVFYSIF